MNIRDKLRQFRSQQFCNSVLPVDYSLNLHTSFYSNSPFYFQPTHQTPPQWAQQLLFPTFLWVLYIWKKQNSKKQFGTVFDKNWLYTKHSLILHEDTFFGFVPYNIYWVEASLCFPHSTIKAATLLFSTMLELTSAAVFSFYTESTPRFLIFPQRWWGFQTWLVRACSTRTPASSPRRWALLPPCTCLQSGAQVSWLVLG